MDHSECVSHVAIIGVHVVVFAMLTLFAIGGKSGPSVKAERMDRGDVKNGIRVDVGQFRNRTR